MAEISLALLEGLRREQVLVLCRVMSRAPFVNLVTVGFICYIVWEYAPAWAVFAWAGVVLTSELVRALYARRTLRAPPSDPGPVLAHLVWIALFVGCARGSAMPLFFASLPPVGYAALSAIFLGFCAGGLSTHGAYARAFYAFATPMLLPMGIAWLSLGGKEGVLLAILFALFAMIVSVFAREIEKLMRESFVIRHQRDELVGQLDRERQEVALARDEAEQANRAKSRFLAAASHDLRQPLHALSLFAAALSLRDTTSGVREISENIGRALRSLSALVDALLDVSRLDAGAMKPEPREVDATAMVARIVAEYLPAAERKGLRLEAVPCDARLFTDPMLLDRMLRNLVDNAIKYTPRGKVVISLEAQTDAMRITVSDTGEGIPPAEREPIFEEFYQIGNPERDRTKGLGLGLAIVRRIGRLLGTEIELASEVGRGSAFSFRLPLSAARPIATPAQVLAAPSSASLHGRRVLVVDDEPDVRVAMRTLLQGWGCRVAVCGGLADAQQLLREHNLEFDQIVADFRLRANENGIQTVKSLRQLLGPIPALLVSGDTAPERIKEANESGFSLLHKPVSADALRSAMLAPPAGLAGPGRPLLAEPASPQPQPPG